MDLVELDQVGLQDQEVQLGSEVQLVILVHLAIQEQQDQEDHLEPLGYLDHLEHLEGLVPKDSQVLKGQKETGDNQDNQVLLDR